MQSSQVNLKDPLLAALLAFLVPGLGHFYQRRLFKAGIFSVCIVSLYVFGMTLSDWKIVQYRGGPGEPRTELLSFIAQSGVGLPGLFAINQTRRYRRSDRQMVTSLREPLVTSFVGSIEILDGKDDLQGELTGTIELAPAVGRFNDPVIVGKIVGQFADGREVELALGEEVRLGPTLRNARRRVVEADIVRETNGGPIRVGRLVNASIPRSFWNWFAVPLSDPEEQALHLELGKYHELALVFTMIAGLLNILAVWDAYDGPAYGYGRENSLEPVEKPPREKATAPQEPAAAGSGR
jgi:hypothetical protein